MSFLIFVVEGFKEILNKKFMIMLVRAFLIAWIFSIFIYNLFFVMFGFLLSPLYELYKIYDEERKRKCLNE